MQPRDRSWPRLRLRAHLALACALAAFPSCSQPDAPGGDGGLDAGDRRDVAVDSSGGDGARDVGVRTDAQLDATNLDARADDASDASALDAPTCGDGVLDSALGELCDIGISSGPGACPTSCDDGDACTLDAMDGSGCQTTCTHEPITALADGDGCCPTGASIADDTDCPVRCGDAVVSAGETCDVAIPFGTGACVVDCDDFRPCTTDMLIGTMCTASCSHTPVVDAVNGDGCCPPGATPARDTDCVLGCGNGVVDPGETCDTAIPVGPGSCPTTCVDGDPCTRDRLAGANCTTACAFPSITMPISGDGCCPPGATAATDADCPP